VTPALGKTWRERGREGGREGERGRVNMAAADGVPVGSDTCIEERGAG